LDEIARLCNEKQGKALLAFLEDIRQDEIKTLIYADDNHFYRTQGKIQVLDLLIKRINDAQSAVLNKQRTTGMRPL
jgi:hypothetical protein